MKPSILFRLGGLALVMAQLLLVLNNLLYLLSGRQPPDTTRSWISLFGFIFFALGVMALYALHAQRSGLIGLLGFILLVFNILGDVAIMAVYLVVAEGLVTIEQVNLVPSFFIANTVINWFAWLGNLIFGYAVYRAGIFPKISGMLLMLIAPVSYLTGVFAWMVPVFIVLSFVTWVWLGWALIDRKAALSREPLPAV